MRHPSRSGQFDAERPLRCQRQTIPSRLAINQEPRTNGLLVSRLGALAIALLSNHKQEPNANTLRPKSLRRRYLDRDNSFGITRPATIDPLFVLRRRDKRRHGV